ncbi:MAG: hypothetical protein CM1200mP10_20890 [Candidatus Neomarinimicrobiota bacterium]|nr:MAG: hypothetical protein CM1200mP10_20890 [Candidatus Neomarinimicrobiota bacterium]
MSDDELNAFDKRLKKALDLGKRLNMSANPKTGRLSSRTNL